MTRKPAPAKADLIRTPQALLLAATFSALTLTACGEPPQAAPGMSGGPVAVSAITVQPETLPLTLEYAAQTLGSREVEVRAQVTGILLKRNYAEGGKVRAGQSLFTIDPAPFAAVLARTEADVAAAEARHAQAKREAARLKPLMEARAVSQKEYDDTVSADAIAAADLLAAKARLAEARLNMNWTAVKSPITGVASRAQKSEGSLVSGPDVLLTTVTQTDPMQVLFGISDNERLKLRQEVAAKHLQWPQNGRFKVTLKFSDGSRSAQTGFTDFADVRVSRDTGTSEARAEIPNPDGQLQPGQFVRVELEGAARAGAFRVPQRAVLEGPQGKFAFVVGKDNKAEIRPVEAGEWTGGDVVITKGLVAGEQVIVDGVLKLGPGAPVQVGAAPAAGAPGKTPAANAKQGG
jgi:membrane fusion protein, multidrug efflux system